MKEFCYDLKPAIDLCDEVPNIPYCILNGPCVTCGKCIYADPFYNYSGEEE